MRRRETAKRLLEVDWTHPVYAPDLNKKLSGNTTTGAAFTTLPRDKALIEICDESDKRPLLVLRECDRCKGSDAALLSRKLDNETTVLLTRWFRCVKLPNDVLDENHPFKALFGDEHPHLFMCDQDGSNYIPLDGNQSQRLLWESMHKVLKRRYRKDARHAIKSIRRLLNQYDLIDIREDEIRDKLDETLLKHGPKSSKVKKLRKALAKVEKDRLKAKAREKKIFDLELIKLEPEPAKSGD